MDEKKGLIFAQFFLNVNKSCIIKGFNIYVHSTLYSVHVVQCTEHCTVLLWCTCINLSEDCWNNRKHLYNKTISMY